MDQTKRNGQIPKNVQSSKTEKEINRKHKQNQLPVVKLNQL